jgi:hypothetical protein
MKNLTLRNTISSVSLTLISIGYIIIESIYSTISHQMETEYYYIFMIATCFLAFVYLQGIRYKYNLRKNVQLNNNYSFGWFLRSINTSLVIYLLAIYLYYGNNVNATANSSKYFYVTGIISTFLGFMLHFCAPKNALLESDSGYSIARENLITLLNINSNCILIMMWVAKIFDFSMLIYSTIYVTVASNLLHYSSEINTRTTKNSRIIRNINSINILLICSAICMLMYWFLENLVYFVTAACSFYISMYVSKIAYKKHSESHNYNPSKNSWFWSKNAFIILIVILLSFRRDFPFDYNHYSYILMPAYTLSAGGAPLVNLNSQYGIGILYFIEFLYYFTQTQFSFSSFSFMVNVLNILFYIMMLYFAWSFNKNIQWIGYLLIIAVMFNRFCQLGGAPEFFPSTGALRFGLPWLYIFYETKTIKNTLSNILRFLIIGIASIWSAEVFAWVMIIYICNIVYKNVRDKSDFSRNITSNIRNILYFVSAVSTAWGLLCADIVFRSGNLPDLSRYTDFLGLYGGGYGFTSPDVRGLWSLIFIVYSTTIVYCITVNASKDSGNSEKVFLISILGILQLTYYVFRSHQNNLYHIMWPAVIIIAYWLEIIVRRYRFIPENWAITSLSAIISSVFLLFVPILTNVSAANNTLLEYVINSYVNNMKDDVWTISNGDNISSESIRARQIISRYSSDNKIFLLISEGLATEILLGSGLINEFQISFEEQDTLIKSGVNGIIRSAQEAPIHSYIYIGKDLEKWSLLKKRIAIVVCSRAKIMLLDDNDVLEVAYLEDKDFPGEGDWCEKHLSGDVIQLEKI